jgi:hypothetical protein
MSFDAVATCLDIRGSVDVAATTRRVVIIPVATCLSFGLTSVEGRGLGGVNHGVILLCSREYWPRAAFRTPRRPGSCV